MFCKYCGSQLSDDARFCTSCGKPTDGPVPVDREPKQPPYIPPYNPLDPQDPPVAKPVARPAAPPPAPLPAPLFSPAPEGEKTIYGRLLSEGETEIRRYYCAKFRYSAFMPPIDGVLTVTNKRILYEAKARNNEVLMESPIDKVGGMKIFYSTSLNFGLLGGGAILLILAVVLFFTLYSTIKYVLPIAFLLLGAVMIAMGIKKPYQLVIYSSGAGTEGITIGSVKNTNTPGPNLMSLQAEATRDTTRMVTELGALIQDVQQMGDGALEKWIPNEKKK